MPNEENPKVEVISKQEYDDMVSAYKAEIRKLQKQNAKDKVAYESELERITAVKDEELKKATIPSLVINLTQESPIIER